MHALSPAAPASSEERGGNGSAWTWVAAVEGALAAAAVVLDLALPALVILVLAGVSLALRHQGPASLGFVRSRRRHLVLGTAVFTVAWSWSWSWSWPWPWWSGSWSRVTGAESATLLSDWERATDRSPTRAFVRSAHSAAPSFDSRSASPVR